MQKSHVNLPWLGSLHNYVNVILSRLSGENLLQIREGLKAKDSFFLIILGDKRSESSIIVGWDGNLPESERRGIDVAQSIPERCLDGVYWLADRQALGDVDIEKNRARERAVK